MKFDLKKLTTGRLAQAGGVFAARSFNSAALLAFTLLAGRILTVEEYGFFGKMLAAMTVVQAFAEAGLQYSLIRFLTPALHSGDRAEAARVLQGSLRLKLYALIVPAAVSLIFVSIPVFASLLKWAGLSASFLPAFSPDVPLSIWIVFVGGSVLSVVSYLDSVLVAHGRYRSLSLWVPLLGIFRLLVLGAFFLADDGMRVEHVAAAFVFGAVLAVAGYFAFFPASFFFPDEVSDVEPMLRKLLLFNRWIVLAAFLAILSDWMEVFLIRSSGETGLYNAARMPLQGFAILLSTMQSFLLPKFSVLKTPAEYGTFLRRLYKYVLPSGLLMIPLFWIGGWFITAWYGASYVPSVSVFYVLLPGYILRTYFAP
ncbi:MAG: hypothetical protein HY042_01370, partial [Spirochaetia bacterium]|nr:hypothetical protein [Spirochaetia bacterium]